MSKKTIKRLSLIAYTIIILIAIGFLISCGTVRGMIDGAEVLSRGVFQDMRAASDGIAARYNRDGGE